MKYIFLDESGIKDKIVIKKEIFSKENYPDPRD